MKNRYFKSFRTRILLLFGISAAFSGFVTIVAYYILKYFYVRYAMFGDIMFHARFLIRNTIGDFAAALILFIPVFFIVFFISTKPYSRMLNEISKGISEIAKGNFDNIITASTDDEIGELARNVNATALTLKNAIETGEFAQTSKDRLVMNIAHDLRTPLTSIHGYLDLIMTNNNLSSDQIKHYTEIAYKKSTKMERLIDNLFDFTKYNYGDKKLVKEKIDLSYMLNQIVEEFYPQFIENNLESRLIIKTKPIYIEADGDMLARVFENIINNAIRHGEEGKYIDIELQIIDELAITRIVNYDSLIPSEELENIFEQFYRVDKSRTNSTGGTGLGLAIAKNIIELHGGTVFATSNFEKTVFEIQLNLY